MVSNLIIEQNRQLLIILSEQECLPLEKLQAMYLKTRSEMYAEISKYARDQATNAEEC